MITTEVIIAKIQNGLKQLAEEHQIPYNQMEIKLFKTDDTFIGMKTGLTSLNLHLIRNGIILENKISIADLFGIGMGISVLISKGIKDKIIEMGNENNLAEPNARFYTKTPDFYPSLMLCDGNKVVKELTVADLT